VTCFRCRAKRHKAPDCPTKPKSNRRVRLPESEPLELSEEELFGAVNDCDTCITIDTGAQISIVPKECVLPGQWTGNRRKVKAFQGTVVEGEECLVQFRIGVPLASQDMLFMMELAKEKKNKDVKLYHPPRMINGELHKGYLVSRGAVIMHIHLVLLCQLLQW